MKQEREKGVNQIEQQIAQVFKNIYHIYHEFSDLFHAYFLKILHKYTQFCTE
jgi:hypothetical protein